MTGAQPTDGQLIRYALDQYRMNLAVLCLAGENPHAASRQWAREELERVRELQQRRGEL